MQGLRHLAEHRADVLRALPCVGKLLLQHDEIAHGDARIGREIVELSADIERLLEMVEARSHHAGHRADGDERCRELRDARLQREHLAVDARQRAAQAAVVGVKYGGGFRHRRTRAVNSSFTP